MPDEDSGSGYDGDYGNSGESTGENGDGGTSGTDNDGGVSSSDGPEMSGGGYGDSDYSSSAPDYSYDYSTYTDADGVEHSEVEATRGGVEDDDSGIGSGSFDPGGSGSSNGPSGTPDIKLPASLTPNSTSQSATAATALSRPPSMSAMEGLYITSKATVKSIKGGYQVAGISAPTPLTTVSRGLSVLAVGKFGLDYGSALYNKDYRSGFSLSLDLLIGSLLSLSMPAVGPFLAVGIIVAMHEKDIGGSIYDTIEGKP